MNKRYLFTWLLH